MAEPMQAATAIAQSATAVATMTEKTMTFLRKCLNPNKQRRIEGQNFIDDVVNGVQDLYDVYDEDRMWRGMWQELKYDIRINQKYRVQADVALLRSENAFKRTGTPILRLRADCLYLQRREGLRFEQDSCELLNSYMITANVHIGEHSQLRPKTARQRDLLDLKDCVIKMREHNLKMLGLCCFDGSQGSDVQSAQTGQQARVVLNGEAHVNADPELLSPSTIYEVNGRAHLNLGPIGGREKTRTTRRSSESISSRHERKSTPDDMRNTDGKSVDAESADDEIRAASSVSTDELATLVGSQLSINTKVQTSGFHSLTAMTCSNAQDDGHDQPDILSTYQDDMALVPRLLPDLPAQLGTLQPAMAAIAETTGKVMSTSSTNTPNPTAVMVTAGFAATATGVNALATAINGNRACKVADRSANAAEKNAKYANTLMGLSLTEHDWKMLAIDQAVEEHEWKREEYLWKRKDQELQLRKTTLECLKLTRELGLQPGPDGGADADGADAGSADASGAASEYSPLGDQIRGAPPPPETGETPYTGPRVGENESEDASDDGSDTDNPPHHPEPWLEADVTARNTRTSLPAVSPVLTTCDLSGKTVTIDINAVGMASQLTSPIDQAEIIEDFATTTAGSVESNNPCKQDDERPSTTPAVVTEGPFVGSTVSLSSRPEPIARKSPNHVLARRSSETFGDDAFKMDDCPHVPAKTMEVSEDVARPSERVPVLAGYGRPLRTPARL